MLPELLLILGLVSINAVLSGSELALISLNDSQLAQMDDRGGSAQIAARLARDHNRFLATIQIGITIAGFMASAVAAVSIAEPLYPVFSVFGEAGDTLAVIVVTVVLAFITLVFGELVPKRLALLHPVRWASRFGRVLDWMATVSTPVVWLLSITTNFFVRLAGGPTSDVEDGHDLADLREIVLLAGSLEHGHDEILRGAIDVVDRSLVGVMTPRTDVVTVSADSNVADAIAVMTSSGFTRLPVIDGSVGLDESPGIVTMHDLVNSNRMAGIESLIRSTPALPESMKVLPALRSMQMERAALAYVIDEFGGVEGIVTVEDLVEELVGEIYDDVDATVEKPATMVDGTILVPGRFPIHDLADYGIEVDDGDYATVAGFALGAFGDVPSAGDRVDVDGWTISVESMSGVNIDILRFVPHPDRDEPSPD
jgi:putative hemolysin